MNLFSRLLLRKPVFTGLLVLLLALAVGFSCIGCSSWSSARAQIAEINGSYRTLAVPTPIDPFREIGSIDFTAPKDGNIYFRDGTVVYSKEHIEAVAVQAPQVERIERCGFLSAALKNCSGLSSGALNIINYNKAFDCNNYSFSVLALKCTQLEEIGVRYYGLHDELPMYEPYFARFEVVGCPSLKATYGDLVGKYVALQGGYALLPTNRDGSPPFEKGKTYLVRCFYLDLPIELQVNHDLSVTPVQVSETTDGDITAAVHLRRIAFLPGATRPGDLAGINPNLEFESYRTNELEVDETTVFCYDDYTVPEDSLPFYAEYTGNWEDFLNTEDGKAWRDTIIPWTKLNQDSAAVVLTDDLNSIYNFNAGIASVMDGRAFSEEEYENGSNVCLVSSGFAMYNDLSVGDVISLDYYKTTILEN